MSFREPLHDRANLARLVSRLETAQSSKHNTWIHARGSLEKIRHAKSLMVTVEDQSYAARLDSLEQTALEEVERLRPRAHQRTSILATLPMPSTPNPDEPTPPATEDVLLPVEPSLELPPEPPTPQHALPDPISALLPPSKPLTSVSNVQSAPAFLASSAQVQEELSLQLAQMAAQLKRNAEHFADSMAKDQAVIEETQSKLEGNFDVMKKERVRLRDHRGKSGGTTWMVITSIGVVVAAWILMFLVIRIT